jgi:hypothetical protein
VGFLADASPEVLTAVLRERDRIVPKIGFRKSSSESSPSQLFGPSGIVRRDSDADDDGDAVGPVHQPRRDLHADVARLQQVDDQVLLKGRTSGTYINDRAGGLKSSKKSKFFGIFGIFEEVIKCCSKEGQQVLLSQKVVIACNFRIFKLR